MDNIVVSGMRQENVQYFTEKEEEFANLLMEIGTRKNIAKVLVFLAKTPEATSLAIEQGTDLRQPEVSLAMAYMMDKSWIRSRECKGERKGRPMKMYTLTKTMNEILDYIENEKKIEAGNQLGRMHKLQEHVDRYYSKLTISLSSLSMIFYSMFTWEEMSLFFAF
jgi:predicted transcriptional regulator